MTKLYTPSVSRAALGLYVSEDHSNTFLVEVKQRVQSNMYTVVINGKDFKRNSHCANEIWNEAANILGSTIEVIPAKHIIKQFEVYKDGIKAAKEQRQLLKLQQAGEASDGHEELCKDLPWK
ncbi:hypothetical protein KUA24_22 [Vibrio phage HNL01]|nr:hypothetical protein KUA24_22 [Vibrio phage HNL01]